MIDAVITWVDGNDPALNAKRAAYCRQEVLKQEDVAAPTRYANVGEIHWCVRSINRFAPWIRKIFIITDGQDPHVESRIPVEIVDHKVVFRGYEEYLPTFNSLSIETMMWRIPDLSEKFLYFNDDFFLCSPVEPSDFFVGDSTPVCYCQWTLKLWTRLMRDLKPKENGRRQVTLRHLALQALDIAGGGLMIPFLEHIPSALLKSRFETYFAAHDDVLRRNARYRFRDLDQYLVDGLQYDLMRREKACVFRSYKGLLFYFKPKGGMEYYTRKFSALEKCGTFKFACLNSLDEAVPEVREKVVAWVESVLAEPQNI